MTIDDDASPVVSTARSADISGEESERFRTRSRQALALGVAFLVGFATSQALAHERRSALVGTPEGQLSLALDNTAGPDYVTDAAGRLAVALSLNIRNTGPVDVVLQAASAGDLSDPEVEGRPLLTEGLTRISLTRTVDCEDLPVTPMRLGPLVVQARTPAGSLQSQLTLPDDPGGRFVQRLQEACGQVSPEDALDVRTTVVRIEDGAARLPLALRNASANDLLLTEVRPVDGLSVELLDADGAAVTLPLRLPAADFAAPRSPDAGKQRIRLTANFGLVGCQAPLVDSTSSERALVELQVETAPGEPPTTFAYGDGDRVLRGLFESDCS